MQKVDVPLRGVPVRNSVGARPAHRPSLTVQHKRHHASQPSSSIPCSVRKPTPLCAVHGDDSCCLKLCPWKGPTPAHMTTHRLALHGLPLSFHQLHTASPYDPLPRPAWLGYHQRRMFHAPANERTGHVQSDLWRTVVHASACLAPHTAFKFKPSCARSSVFLSPPHTQPAYVHTARTVLKTVKVVQCSTLHPSSST
jgi:hypothetical protein